MSRISAETSLLFRQTKVNMDGVVSQNGEVDNAQLRRFLIQETGLTPHDKFLTDYTAAFDIEFDSIDNLSQSHLISALRQLLVRNISKDNYTCFSFQKTPNAKDPFALPRSEFQELFNCIELSTATMMYGLAYASLGGMPFGIGFLLGALSIVLSPALLLANRAGALATQTSQMNIPVAGTTWIVALAATVSENYALYHNVFPSLYAAVERKMQASPKGALTVCHYLCFCMATVFFTLNVFAIQQAKLGQRFPSERFEALLKAASTKQFSKENTDDDQALMEKLSTTNFPAFLIEAKKKGGAYEKAAKLIIEAHLLGIERRAPAHVVSHSIQN